MSLVNFALRICTVYALRGRTFAGAEVHDSPTNPVPALLEKVTITVFSGTGTMTPDGRELISVDSDTELEMHIHVPDKVDLSTGSASVTVHTRQGGSGIVFDFIHRQIVRALLGDSEWAKLWRTFAAKVGKVSSAPYILEADKGQRLIESRALSMSLFPIYDPLPGELPEGSPWLALLAQMEAEPETQAIAAALRHELESPTGLPDWNLAGIALGLAPDELTAIGIVPVQPPPLPSGPPNEPVRAFVFDNTDSGEQITLDANTGA